MRTMIFEQYVQGLDGAAVGKLSAGFVRSKLLQAKIQIIATRLVEFAIAGPLAPAALGFPVGRR